MPWSAAFSSDRPMPRKRYCETGVTPPVTFNDESSGRVPAEAGVADRVHTATSETIRKIVPPKRAARCDA